MVRTRALSKAGQRGFSLVEVIVVVAIMAVLGSVLVPQLLRYVNQNRAKACQVDREGILAVYERCVYAETKALNVTDLAAVMDASDPDTEYEVKQFDKCPLGGTYSATVVGDLAIIDCDCDGHEEVSVDFSLWDGTELAEGIDEPFAKPPTPSVSESDEPTTEEPSSEEEPPAGDGVWPYADDPRWIGAEAEGIRDLYIDVPIMFTSKEGTSYVVVDAHNNGKFKVLYEDRHGPEFVDADDGGEAVISVSGITINDVKTILHPTNKNAITGVNYGDIVIYKGYKYIYGSHDTSAEKNFPVEGKNGNNFFLIGLAD